ncbi:heterokaryon incompatibility het-6 [Fusarium albosuccineum]|uniref:Heterokaryon incompatibility het-6 n=1 Tax=Fusarium albosuccineum TaxID=1237068 RepID=A0A8H4NS06_9HYPO|nr:heterokaryon incompatibility het-6 [Fusarium albosuccineum]
MSRWHEPSCKSPAVFVTGALPYCRSCDQSPDIEKLVAEQARASPPWAVPPDEALGELHLYWPETVLYKSQSTTQLQSRGRLTVDGANASKDNATDHLDVHAPPASPIYKKRLSDAEFRVLHISAATDSDSPVHAVLEDHRTDDCPEYEAVSYCWGGEDGNSKRSHPIYLGDYWDILLQTNNCWSMLQHLRPRTGARPVWVDAVCINQEDHFEREIQVSMMGNIYRRCLRAIIYLGEDVVPPKGLARTKHRTYPGRHDLSEFQNIIPASLTDLKQLFKLKYFQRVWVIQEVIQAPAAVIPAYGHHFMVGPQTPDRMQSTDWNSTNAPWMQHICTGEAKSDLLRLLQQTRASQATDPRDKVFGLLGFALRTQNLRPDYSISSLHTYIGTITHLLLNDHFIGLLTGASGHPAGPKFPSWLPNWNLLDMGARLLLISDYYKHVPSRQFDRSPFGKLVADLDPECQTLLKKTCVASIDYHSDFMASALWSTDQPSIDPSTLELSISLIHLCQFTSPIVQVHQYIFGQPCRVFEIETANSKLYVCTSDTPFDSIVEPGRNELFLLAEPNHPTLLLAMRYLPENGKYRLLKCCFCFDIFLSRNPFRRPRFMQVDPNSPKPPRTRNKKGPSVSILGRTVHKALTEVAEGLEKLSNQSRETLTKIQAFEGQHRLDQEGIITAVLAVFRKLVSDPGTGFLDSYVDFLLQCCPNCSAKAEGETVYMTISPKTWAVIHGALNWNNESVKVEFFSPLNIGRLNPWTWHETSLHPETYAEGTVARRHMKLLDSFFFESNFGHLACMGADVMSTELVMKLSAQSLREWLEKSPYFELVFSLRTCGRIVDEDETVLTTEEPRDEYRSICYYNWPDSFLDGQSPGRIRRVTIV